MSQDEFDTSVLLLDVETTGIKPTDQVIELAVQYGFETHDDAGNVISAPVTVWRFKPDVPIHPAAQKVHGITPEMLAREQPFKFSARRISDLLNEAQVLIGYNVKFDLEMLAVELQRAGAAPIDYQGKYVVDPYRLWQRCEPRGLQEAHRRFVGGDFDQAHSAAADIAATARVALGMIEAFQLQGKHWGEIADLADPDRKLWLGGSNHFRWSFESGAPLVVVAFGKHKDTVLTELASTNSGYLRWMVKQDFPQHVKLVCQKATSMRAHAFLQWAMSAFPPPESTEAAPP